MQGKVVVLLTKTIGWSVFFGLMAILVLASGVHAQSAKRLLKEDNGRRRKRICNISEGCRPRDRGAKPCLRYIGLSSGQRDIVADDGFAIKTKP
jgi:hypothetical protein